MVRFLSDRSTALLGPQKFPHRFFREPIFLLQKLWCRRSSLRILALHVFSSALSVACFDEYPMKFVRVRSLPVHCLLSAFLCRHLALVPTSVQTRTGRIREHLSVSHKLLLLLHKSSCLLNASSKHFIFLQSFSFFRVVLSHCPSRLTPSNSELQLTSDVRYRYQSVFV